MKKTYYLFIFILITLLSCQKEAETINLKSLLLGNWNYEKLVTSSYTYDGRLAKELVTPISSSNYGYHFYDDGTCTQRFGGEPSKFSYKIISETEFEVNTGVINSCKVVLINETETVFVTGGQTNVSSNYTTSTHYLTR